MRIAAAVGLFFVAHFVSATPARADSRVALVIGNSAYQHVPFLPNPVNDVADLSVTMARLGFSVKVLTDGKYDEMRRALIEFGQLANGADLAVVFFAGHGIQMGGENWLIPVDAQLATDLNVANEAIGLQSFTRAVSNTTKLGLVILDACRSNPFLPKMQSTNISRAVERGFSRVEPSDNILVAYSARDGTTARDGSGRNSPFTRSLLKNIEVPGLEVRFLFANIRDDVMAVTNREQQPFVYGSLSKDPIYFVPTLNGHSDVITSILTKRPSNLDSTSATRIVSISGQMETVVNGVTKVRGARATTNNKKLPVNSYKTTLKIDGDHVFAQDPNNDFALECSLGTPVSRRYADIEGQHVEASCSYKRNGAFYNIEKVVKVWSENSGGSRTSDVTQYSSQFSILGNSCSSIGESFTKSRDIQSLKFSNTEAHLQSSGVLSSEKCELVSLDAIAR